MKSIWLLFSCPESGRQKYDLFGDFNLGGVGGELEFEEEKKPLKVFIKAEICYRGSSCPA